LQKPGNVPRKRDLIFIDGRLFYGNRFRHDQLLRK
jgi:hypothetical protein